MPNSLFFVECFAYQTLFLKEREEINIKSVDFPTEHPLTFYVGEGEEAVIELHHSSRPVEHEDHIRGKVEHSRDRDTMREVIDLCDGDLLHLKTPRYDKHVQVLCHRIPVHSEPSRDLRGG